jgi:uncharacterized MAPEG superfamily protein
VTIAYWCVLIAGILPLLGAAVAKWKLKGSDGRNYNNHNPREWLARQEGLRARANASQLNGFEAFPFFAAGVIIAHLAQASQTQIDLIGIAFIGCRLAYFGLYLANLATLRSVVWFAGYGCTIALFLIGR